MLLLVLSTVLGDATFFVGDARGGLFSTSIGGLETRAVSTRLDGSVVRSSTTGESGRDVDGGVDRRGGVRVVKGVDGGVEDGLGSFLGEDVDSGAALCVDEGVAGGDVTVAEGSELVVRLMFDEGVDGGVVFGVAAFGGGVGGRGDIGDGGGGIGGEHAAFGDRGGDAIGVDGRVEDLDIDWGVEIDFDGGGKGCDADPSSERIVDSSGGGRERGGGLDFC